MTTTQQPPKPERLPIGGSSPAGGYKVDRASRKIEGVCIATAGVPARGHGYDDEQTGEFVEFWTDAETLTTMLACALSVGEPLKAKLEHGTGLKEIVGTYSNWRIEGEKLLADYSAAPTCSREVQEHIFWMAETMPGQFGVSVTAVFSKQRSGQTAHLRCVELRSADFVDEPALNESLFSQTTAATESPHNKNKKETMNEEQLKELKAEIVKELADSQKEAIAEAVKEAVAEVIAAQEAKPNKELEEKPDEAEEKPDEAEEKQDEEKLSVKTLAAAVAKELRKEAFVLGLAKGVSVQSQSDSKGSGKTYESVMASKASSGKRFHVALSEVEREHPDLVKLECKRLGVPSSAYLTR